MTLRVVTCIWRAGDLLLPLRATSSCHRCRSKAGWRDRQVLSGCKLTLRACRRRVNGQSRTSSEIASAVADTAIAKAPLFRRGPRHNELLILVLPATSGRLPTPVKRLRRGVPCSGSSTCRSACCAPLEGVPVLLLQFGISSSASISINSAWISFSRRPRRSSRCRRPR